MAEIREDVVEDLDQHQETMRLLDFVRIIEAHHHADSTSADGKTANAEEGSPGGVERESGVERKPGVERETLAAYAEAVYFDVDLEAIDERVTDSDEWVEGEHFYQVGEGRISVYPPNWHATLSDTDDLRDVIEVIQSDVTEPEGDMSQAVTDERGVPEEKVLRVAETVAGIDRDTARDEIEKLRKNGEIEEFASQHRNPTIRLS